MPNQLQFIQIFENHIQNFWLSYSSFITEFSCSSVYNVKKNT